MFALHFLDDPAAFLERAGPHLEADPVVSTVVSSIAHRALAQEAAGRGHRDGEWWLVITDASDSLVGVAMRTAPFSPYPPFLLPMPDDAARQIARTLHQRGEEVRAVNGALPAVEVFAAETVALAGGRVEVAAHTRLHELGELVMPAQVPGRLVTATEADLPLTAAWFEAFMGDADEQAGRPRGSSAHEAPDEDEIRRRLRAGTVWFWVDASGERVHLTAANPPAFGVARVGPVYTPPGQRGRGWASAAVAEVSAVLQGQGARVCLYTDQANPTSNKIYAALGYRPVVDMANLVLTA
jgi:GNAT superfamily N-acetyltransferase